MVKYNLETILRKELKMKLTEILDMFKDFELLTNFP